MIKEEEKMKMMRNDKPRKKVKQEETGRKCIPPLLFVLLLFSSYDINNNSNGKVRYENKVSVAVYLSVWPVRGCMYVGSCVPLFLSVSLSFCLSVSFSLILTLLFHPFPYKCLLLPHLLLHFSFLSFPSSFNIELPLLGWV
jgi:hypothetical protein